MRNYSSGFKIALLFSCFHVFKHSCNTSKDKSQINPVILTQCWTWVAKGSSWERSFNTRLSWLNLCLSVFSLLAHMKKVKGLYNEPIKFEVQAASPNCVFSDAQCQLLMYRSTQMSQRLVGNCASTLLGNNRIAGLKSLFWKVCTTTGSFGFHVKPCTSWRGFEDEHACIFTCYISISSHCMEILLEENGKIK